jgi:HPt (histidine-containing phosphotransfer) domain-containing protein
MTTDWSDPELRALREAFIATLPGRADRIREAWRRGDAETFGGELHKLAGAAGSYGLDQLSALACALEDRLDGGTSPAELGTELEAVLQAIAELPSEG